MYVRDRYAAVVPSDRELVNDGSASVPTLADSGELMVECLSEYGFDAEAQGTGLTAEVIPAQAQAYEEALAACESKHGFDAMTAMTEDRTGARSGSPSDENAGRFW